MGAKFIGAIRLLIQDRWRRRTTLGSYGVDTGILRKLVIMVALALGTWLGTESAALADRRVALVIGNAKYEHASVLANTTNDAQAIVALLSKAGFDFVEEHSNLGVVEFKRAIREFVDLSRDADIAVVYYSGHGLEVGGVNYLIPVDAKLSTVLDMEDEAVSLDRLLIATGRVKKLSLIILDACRENPFHPSIEAVPRTRAVSGGLAGVIPSVSDTLVAFAAKAGSFSYDGDGPNSPFTSALVKYITRPGLDIRIAFGMVRDDVLRATGNRQEPYVYGSLGGGDVALVPATPTEPAPSAPPAASVDLDEWQDYRMAERVGSLEAWRAFLSLHSSGLYAELARAQIKKLQDSPTAEATGIPARPVPPSPGVEAAALTPDENCKRDGDRLARLRTNPSGEEARHFASELSCEQLRPQLLRLMESLGFDAPAQKALTTPPHPDRSQPERMDVGDCASEQAALDRLRAEPSAEAAQDLWRHIRCDRLRAQVRLLLESLNLTPEPLASTPASGQAESRQDGVSAAPVRNRERGISEPASDGAAGSDACRREMSELNNIRKNPNLRDAERFARNATCDAVKPQAARLLESLTQ